MGIDRLDYPSIIDIDEDSEGLATTTRRRNQSPDDPAAKRSTAHGGQINELRFLLIASIIASSPDSSGAREAIGRFLGSPGLNTR